MASKIEAAQFAVSPGSQCRACVVVSGNDLNAIRALANSEYELEDDSQPKGTLFVTPGSELEKQALEDIKAIEVSGNYDSHVTTCSMHAHAGLRRWYVIIFCRHLSLTIPLWYYSLYIGN
jgi:hypothetical protein